MGITQICEHGYQTAACRCTKVHWPVPVVPCPPHHVHTGLPVDKNGKPANVSDEEWND